MFKFSRRSEGGLVGVLPDLVLITTEAIKICPIDYGIAQDGGLRTSERQHEMFLDPDIQTNADGYTNVSNHQAKDDGYGHAIDFYAYINGAASWHDRHVAMIYAAHQIATDRLLKEGRITHQITWGGTFGSKDMTGWDACHIQTRKI